MNLGDLSVISLEKIQLYSNPIGDLCQLTLIKVADYKSLEDQCRLSQENPKTV